MNETQAMNWTCRKFKNLILSIESKPENEPKEEIIEVKPEIKKLTKKELKELQLTLF